MPYIVTDEKETWKSVHSQGRCGGPRFISMAEEQIVADFRSTIDGVSDAMLHSKKDRLYHKAGLTIFESDGTFPGLHRLRQISRYNANSMRITWDLNWQKNAFSKTPVELGSAVLPGKWRRMYEIPRIFPETGEPGTWKELKEEMEIQWDTMPAVLIFEREDGRRVEFSLGFDVWRWDAALGIPNSVPVTVQVQKDSLIFTRRIADAGNEETFPQPRDYRFMSIVAWSNPELHNLQLPEATLELTAADGKGLDLSGVNWSDINETALKIDFSRLPMIENAKRMNADGARSTAPCLDDSYAMTSMKRCIRQLAAASDHGILIAAGLIPGLCWDGTHCAKKNKKIHFDLQDIMTFADWAKNCLGEGWKLYFPQPEGWNQLPSLAGLNG